MGQVPAVAVRTEIGPELLVRSVVVNLVDLVRRIAADPLFGITEEEILAVLDPALYTGRAASQTDEFLAGVVEPLLARYPDTVTSELKV